MALSDLQQTMRGHAESETIRKQKEQIAEYEKSLGRKKAREFVTQQALDWRKGNVAASEADLSRIAQEGNMAGIQAGTSLYKQKASLFPQLDWKNILPGGKPLAEGTSLNWKNILPGGEKFMQTEEGFTKPSMKGAYGDLKKAVTGKTTEIDPAAVSQASTTWEGQAGLASMYGEDASTALQMQQPVITEMQQDTGVPLPADYQPDESIIGTDPSLQPLPPGPEVDPDTLLSNLPKPSDPDYDAIQTAADKVGAPAQSFGVDPSTGRAGGVGLEYNKPLIEQSDAATQDLGDFAGDETRRIQEDQILEIQDQKQGGRRRGSRIDKARTFLKDESSGKSSGLESDKMVKPSTSMSDTTKNAQIEKGKVLDFMESDTGDKISKGASTAGSVLTVGKSARTLLSGDADTKEKVGAVADIGKEVLTSKVGQDVITKGTEKVAGEVGKKVAGKTFGRFVPGVGSALAIAGGAKALFGKGDWKSKLSGGLSLLGGVASFVPGVGTAVSTGLNLASTGVSAIGAMTDKGVEPGDTIDDNYSKRRNLRNRTRAV